MVAGAKMVCQQARERGRAGFGDPFGTEAVADEEDRPAAARRVHQAMIDHVHRRPIVIPD